MEHDRSQPRFPGDGEAPSTATSSSPPTILVALAAVSMFGALYASLIYAPTDRVQGDIQRLFYLHVPASLTMYLAVVLVFIASVLYLQTRDSRWDEVAAAGGDMGLLFGTIVILTGPVWARPVWGWWWTWDARLTSFFILWLIFVAYVMLRNYGGSPDQVARFCSVLAVLGFIGMPITHYSVEWWRGMHPEPVIMTEGGLGRNLPGTMLAAAAVGLIASVALFVALFLLRLRLERQGRQAHEVRRQLDFLETH